MSKIKIYDADAFIRKEAEMACHTFQKVAILEGPHGIVVAEKEAVHDVLNDRDDTFRFDLTKIPSPGHMYLIPSAYVDIPIREILDRAPSVEMEFYDFFSRRNYNPRCENNFRYLCGELRDIGYPIPKEPLTDKLKSAQTRVASAQTHSHTVPAAERG